MAEKGWSLNEFDLSKRCGVLVADGWVSPVLCRDDWLVLLGQHGVF
jgi:hypothetical protein